MKIPDITDKRPNDGDQGRRVWVWELPGTHHSQIRTGVLVGWDETDLRLVDGNLVPWVVIKDWGFGDPPKAES